MEQTIDYAIALDPDFANFYPAVPYPGTALYEKCVRDGLLPAGADDDWSKMEYSYYLLRGNGLDEQRRDGRHQPREAAVLPAARLHGAPRRRRRAARRSPSRHRRGRCCTRTLFGAQVVDTSTAVPRPPRSKGSRASGRRASLKLSRCDASSLRSDAGVRLRSFGCVATKRRSSRSWSR